MQHWNFVRTMPFSQWLYRKCDRLIVRLVRSLPSIGLLLAAALVIPFSVSAMPEVPIEVFDRQPVTLEKMPEVLDRLSPGDVFRARFVQEKEVAGLLRPVRSEGRFLFSRTDGIVWEAEKPFASRLVITPEGVRRDVEGQPSRFYQASKDPAARGVSEVFLGLFGAQAHNPETIFNVYDQDNGAEGWVVGLQPKDSNLSQYLQSIVVSGDKGIDRLWIREGQDVTFIRMESVSGGNGALTLEERSIFDMRVDSEQSVSRMRQSGQ